MALANRHIFFAVWCLSTGASLPFTIGEVITVLVVFKCAFLVQRLSPGDLKNGVVWDVAFFPLLLLVCMLKGIAIPVRDHGGP
jgi:hypothetical protein